MPNLLLIMTDQQSFDALGCRGGAHPFTTPHLDRLAAGACDFSLACTASPVCFPARNSLFTGRYPHDTRVECNRDHPRSRKRAWPDRKATRLPEGYRWLGSYFREAGYDTGYFGKWHLNADKKDRRRHGFATTEALADIGHDPQIADAAARFIRAGRDRPFLAVASFCDPHDICQHADGRDLPGGPLPDPPPDAELPPLRFNAAPSTGEGDILAALREAYRDAHVRRGIQAPADVHAWRIHRWAYRRLVERVDALVGRVLDALDTAGHADDTVVVFTSDHGDLRGAHGLVQKTLFYDEAVRVPLLVKAPGAKPRRCTVPVNNCTDILPTLLDYAGLPAPELLPGRSLRPWVEGEPPRGRPDHAISQVHCCSPKMTKGTPHAYGRLVRTERYSYWIFDHGRDPEVLFDCHEDPGQLRDLAREPGSAKILAGHRERLADHARRTGDKRAATMLRRVTGWTGPD